MEKPETNTVRLELAPATIARVAGAAAGAWLLYRLRLVVLLVVVALVLVGTFNPVIESLEKRGFKRAHALLLLILSLGLAAALLIFLTLPPLIEQIGTIAHDLPGRRDQLVAALAAHQATAALGRPLGGIGLADAVGRLQGRAFDFSYDAAAVAGGAVTTLFLSFYLLMDGKRTQGALYALVPRPYHMRTARIIHNLETIVGGYMRGQLITSAAFGAFTFALLFACGARNALALALFASLADVLPFVGGLLAIVPSVLTALGRGPGAALFVFAGMAAYQQFEDRILVPKVYGRALRLSPAAVVLALVAGGTLLGVLGALLALPIAAGLQMIVEELGVDLPGDDSDDSQVRARDEKTEAAYELMSAGSTAPEAGRIASGLASDIRDADARVAANEAKKDRSHGRP